MFAAVVCYAIGVWLAIAVIEHSNAFAAFKGNVYWFAAALSVVIPCAIGFAAIIVTPAVARLGSQSLHRTSSDSGTLSR